jgi:hypothetical protein
MCFSIDYAATITHGLRELGRETTETVIAVAQPSEQEAELPQ